MKVLCKYGAWINGAYVPMTRKHWLVAFLLTFPEQDITEIKKQIKSMKLSGSHMRYYRPEVGAPYHVPAMYAEYQVSKDKKWFYIHREGKEKSVMHAIVKFCRKFNIDHTKFKEDNINNWTVGDEKNSCLDPSWEPTLKDVKIFTSQLEDINYHSFNTEFQDAVYLKHNLI